MREEKKKMDKVVEIIDRSQYDWNNQWILERNREPARVDFYPFEDLESAKKGDIQRNSRIEILNGLWSFEWFDCPWKVTEEIINKKVLEDEPKIYVPLNWQYAGFGERCYANLLYPFPVDPPFVSNQNETGVYRKKFRVENLKGNIFVRFEGVESAFHVYVNGRLVGYSQGSRLPSEFNITEYVVYGDNQITVEVYQYSDGSYLEDQDMWWLGGIIRDVVVIYRPKFYLKNCVLDPDFDVETGEGILNPKIECSNSEVRVGLSVWSQNEKLVTSFELDKKISSLRIKNILPWTAETPNLYIVTIQLFDKLGNTLEVIRQKIGFRHIEIHSGELKLNGKRIFMKGVNRHEYNPKTGRAITKKQIYEELLLIKEMGCNAIRCSHYPNNSYFYEVCDQLGIYVIDECDLETHGLEPIGLQKLLCDDPEWEKAYLDRLERMVSRDRNHPCVLLWSLGNESSYGRNFRVMYQWCKENEPSRPVHYEGDFKNQSVDVSSTMYSTIGELKELDLQLNPKRPHILCEFGHAMGNGPGSLKEYFRVCEESERIQGLFIWEFKDHGVEKIFSNGKMDYAFGGEFGETFHSGNFCMDGLVRSDGVPTPGLLEYSKVIQPITVEEVELEKRIVVIKNKFDFIDLSFFMCKLSVIVDGKIENIVYIDLPKIDPKCKGEMALPIELYQVYRENHLVVWELEFISQKPVCHRKKNGWKVGRKEIVYQDEKAIAEEVRGGMPEIEVRDDRIYITGDDFSVEISLSDGRIYNYRRGKKVFINAGPILNYNRPFTDNDEINKIHWMEKHLHSMQMNISHICYEEKKDGICIKCRGRFSPKAMGWGTNINIIYNVLRGGEIAISIQGDFYGEVPSELPKIGTQSEIPEEFQIIKWKGLGPGECYGDSCDAQMEGIWEQIAKHMGFKYSCPQENGNRTGVQWATLKNQKGEGVVVSAYSKIDMSIRCYSDKEIEKAKHNSDLKEENIYYWNLDYKNSGLGSGSCGPSAMPQYKVYPIPFELDLILKCINETESELEVARKLMGILGDIKEKTIGNRIKEKKQLLY